MSGYELMVLTDKQVDLLLSGAVGAIGAILGASASFVGSMVFGWFADRRRQKGKLDEFRFRIGLAKHGSTLSNVLRELRDFLIQNNSLLKRDHLKAFFDRWLTDAFLEFETHSELATHSANDGMVAVHMDADEQLRFRLPLNFWGLQVRK